jgi:glycosyltransferase involved in cell wall biosynthesis
MKTSLSICITVHNRSKVRYGNDVLRLFPNCLGSLVDTVKGIDNAEIIIADWDSTDWKLNEWIHDCLRGMKYTLVIEKGAFNRGKGRNIAADHASGDILFFLDADMLLDAGVITKGMDAVSHGAAYFPECFYFIDKQHKQGFWCTGKGNCMVTREWYERAGKWPCPPVYNKQVDEDWVFFDKVSSLGIPIHSAHEPGLLHQFHPGRSVNLICNRQRHLIQSFKEIL